MSDPPRLLDDSDNPLIVEMLSAARQQSPRRRAVHGTLLAVGSVAGVAGTHATAGAAAGGVAAASLAKLAAKWTLLSAVVVGGGVASVESGMLGDSQSGGSQADAKAIARATAEGPAHAVSQPPSQVDSAKLEDVRAAAATAAAAAAAVGPAAAVGTQASSDTSALAAQPPRAATRSPAHERLNQEVALLDRARRALALADAARALTLSSRYLEQFPGGRMEQEARYLMMQAAKELGDAQRAEQEALRLIELNPAGPHAKAAAELLSSTQIE